MTALTTLQTADDKFEDHILYNFELAPHATPFGPGPTPGTVWDSESWLAMIEDTDPFEGPSSSVHEHEDDHPTPPTPPPTPPATIQYRVYSPNPSNPEEEYEITAEVADPLIGFLAVEGVHAADMCDGAQRELSDLALRKIDAGLLDLTDAASFHYLAVPDGGKYDEDLDWIGVDLEKDGDFDVFLGYGDDPDALPVFVTIAAGKPDEIKDADEAADALF